jgi:hypothetical protein
LGSQLERVYATFPAEQVKCLVFDDFTNDTKCVYRDILGFLGVTSDERDEFPKLNDNKIHRSKFLGSLFFHPPQSLRFAWRHLRKIYGVEISKFIERLIQMNSTHVPRTPLDPEFRRQLAREFEADVNKLSCLLGRDLTHWTYP